MENPVAQGVTPVTPPAPQPAAVQPSTPSPSGNGSNRKKKAGFFAVLAAIVLLGAVGLTVFLGQQNTNNQQHADSSVVAGTCGPLATDTLLVFDRSNSMKQPVNASADTLFAEPHVPGDTTVSSDDPDADQESSDEDVDVPADDQVIDPNDTQTATPSVTVSPTAVDTQVPTATATLPVFPPTATPTPTGALLPSVTGTSASVPTVPFPTGVLRIPVYDGNTKLAKAQAAMRFYVDQVGKDSRNKVGLISFGPKARTDKSITSDYSGVKTKINALKTSQGTCLSCGVNIANKQMEKLPQDNNRARAIILVSDGIANRVVRKGKSVKPGKNKNDAKSRSAKAALHAAVNGYKKHGVPFYTIALGTNSNKDLMKNIADQTHGQYYFAPSEDDLQKIYADIVSTLGQGKVSGQVFVDANGNGQKDGGERLLPGWTVVLTKKAAGSAQSTDTDASAQSDVAVQSNNNNKKNNNKKNNNKTLPILPTAIVNDTLSCSPTNLTSFPQTITATLKDANGQPLKNKKITFSKTNDKIDFSSPGKDKIVNTNDQGIASIKVGLKKSKNTVTGTITGKSSNASCAVSVNGQDPSITITGDTGSPEPSGDSGSPEPSDDTGSPSGIPAGSLVAVTDKDGNYTFTGVCSGDYEISLQPQPGWTVTVPTDNNNKYEITIDKGSSFKDRDFGVTGHDVTVTGPTGPSITGTNGVSLSLTVFMHGIGKSGDNANPFPDACNLTASTSASDQTGCLSNQSPLTPTRPMTVEIFGTEADSTPDNTADDVPLDTGTGTLTYNASAGNFSGTVNLDKPLDTGTYTIKISSTKYLTKSFGVVTIKPGLNTLPVTSMIVGDAFTQDSSKNTLDILDYNALLGCFSITAPAKDCQIMPNQKTLTDLDDDGQVNQNDYNLFIRELSTQYGD